LFFEAFYGILYGTMGPKASLPAFRSALLPVSLALLLGTASPAMGQTAATTPDSPAEPASVSSQPVVPVPVPETVAPPASVQPLLGFQDSEVKFSLSELMGLLRDRRHEGWVLAAYPDPKTGRPLIGAGFSLDLPERQHPQNDPLNPHSFLEPSSAALWQAAGLDPARLQTVLEQFDQNLAAWKTMKRYRRRIWSLAPQITDDEANSLLRIAAIQAIENARAYCRNFDQLSGPQQMAMSQLVYQMGVNLSEFGRFLNLMNDEPVAVSALADPTTDNGNLWRSVQQSLIQSQWARLYRVRAVSVIAMLDPRYLDDPAGSEQRVAAVLHPAVHRRRGRTKTAMRMAAYHRRSGPPGHAAPRKTARARATRKA
jgi:hypothetical protein